MNNYIISDVLMEISQSKRIFDNGDEARYLRCMSKRIGHLRRMWAVMGRCAGKNICSNRELSARDLASHLQFLYWRLLACGSSMLIWAKI